MAAPLCIFRTLWQEKNKIAFEGVDISINMMKSTFLSNLWCWVNMYCAERPRSLIDFFCFGWAINELFGVLCLGG